MKILLKKVFFVVFFSAIGGLIGSYIGWNLVFTIDSLKYPGEYIDIDRIVEENDFLKKDLFLTSNIIADYEILFWEFDRFATNKLEKRTRPLWSPNEKRIAYMEKTGEESENPDTSSRYSLITINPFTLKLKEIYKTDSNIFDWFWLDDNKIMVYYNTDTGNMFVDTINVKTRQITNKYVGSDCQWSADKEWYFISRSDNQYTGISICDKYQKTVFHYWIENDKYRDYMNAVWSPIDDYLALVKEKGNEDQLELLIVDFNKDEKVLTQKNLGEEGCTNMWWDSDREFICYHSQKGRLEFKISGI